MRGSLPAISSALNCYAAFCELRGLAPFPPTEQKGSERGAVLSDTATYTNYISHLQKARFFARAPVTWLTPAARHISKGLKKCQGASFRFPNFIRGDILLRLLKMGAIRSEIAQACVLSLLFAFRVPSETLQLRRAYSDDHMLSLAKKRERVHTGVLPLGGDIFLVDTLSFRKNLAGGGLFVTTDLLLCTPRTICTRSLSRSRHSRTHLFTRETGIAAPPIG